MILLIGPSAVGKTEIAKELKNLYNIQKVITHTTRKKRQNEINDVDYHFVTVEEFIKLKNQNYFVETTIYNGNYYGTSKEEIKNDKVLIVDTNGKNNFLNLHDKDIVIFYIMADENKRIERMKSRGDSEETIKNRILFDRINFNNESKNGVDFFINNENKSLKEVTEEIYQKYISK